MMLESPTGLMLQSRHPLPNLLNNQLLTPQLCFNHLVFRFLLLGQRLVVVTGAGVQ
jgi:hypothetical protein